MPKLIKVAEITNRQSLCCAVKYTLHYHLQINTLSSLSSKWTWVSWYQKVAILDCTGANHDGGGSDN